MDAETLHLEAVVELRERQILALLKQIVRLREEILRVEGEAKQARDVAFLESQRKNSADWVRFSLS